MKTTTFLISMFLLLINFVHLQAEINKNHAYFLDTYQNICSMPDNDPKKIDEFNVLLAQVDAYYEGLPATYYPSGKLAWIILCGLGAQCFSENSVFSFCLRVAALANALAFCYDASTYTHNANAKRELFACLESLQAAIQERLDQKRQAPS
ncbi:hypothetical protein A3J41_01955 [candidate division TM6 bacterium RIFCSPHIGHO2_12_FULL_38_8]|nr:MAG: hypothetical protein A3J41_01955 [candidate division TM6 bacterium RIFCSPHIGHO2_12_FULL_38_8]